MSGFFKDKVKSIKSASMKLGPRHLEGNIEDSPARASDMSYLPMTSTNTSLVLGEELTDTINDLSEESIP